MLRIQVDMFSGRPNPEWIITDTDRVNDLLREVAAAKGATSRPGRGFLGLGFREIRVTSLGDDPVRRRGVPREFALASVAAEDLQASGQIARAFLETMPVEREGPQLVAHELTPLTRDLRDLIYQRLDLYLRKPPHISVLKWPPYNPLRTTIDDELCPDCEYEVSQFNPGFWNAPSVQPYNNCYNYARNWRTDTFAQPGRAHGAQTSTMACGTVTTAAMADGLVKRCKCLPRSEWPRRLMALVIDPGYDYHWYRHQRGGFWGHKPGQTAARNVDNSGNLIVNPETCDRGGYTDFCEYFYAGKSVVIN
jgi:hypothetical protein